MLITFDIDDTIRLHGGIQSREPALRRALATALLYREPVRPGFTQICHDLKHLGWKVGIYTTSSRSVRYIRRWMKCYGLIPDLIVNGPLHEQAISGHSGPHRSPSKHPGLFGVDLHIDDAQGVAVEGERFGFRTLIIDPEDLEWHRTILKVVKDFPPNLSIDIGNSRAE